MLIDVIKRQVFSINGKDAFQLTLEFIPDTNKYFITSNLPDWLIDKLPLPEFEVLEKSPFFIIEQVNQKLSEFASELNAMEVTKIFHYPDFFLDDNGKYRVGVAFHYTKAITDFKMKKVEFISIHDSPYESIYLSLALFSLQHEERSRIHVNDLSREEFEARLNLEKQKENYIDLYHKIESFINVEISDITANTPSYIAGVDSKGMVLIAFVNHSIVLNSVSL